MRLLKNRILVVAIVILVTISLMSNINNNKIVNISAMNMKFAEPGGYIPQKANDIIKGKPYTLLYYYSQDCMACDRQHATLKQLSKSWDSKDIKVVAVNAWDKDPSLGEEAKFYDAIYWDAYMELAKGMKLIGTPSLIFVNETGEVFASYNGYKSGDQLNDIIKKL